MKLKRPTTTAVDAGAMLSLMGQPALMLNGSGTILFANQAYRKLISGKTSSWVGRDFLNCLDAESAVALTQFIADCNNNTAKPGDAVLDAEFTAFGFLLAVTVQPLNDSVTGDLVYICLGKMNDDIDIDDYNEIRNSEMRWRTAFHSAGHAVWDTARSEAFFVSDNWYTMRGIKPADITGDEPKECLNEIHPDDKSTIHQTIERQNTDGIDDVHYQYRQRHRDGHWIWILSKGKVVSRCPDGSPTA